MRALRGLQMLAAALQSTPRAALRAATASVCGALLAGCTPHQPLGYYWQAASGHVQLLASSQPVAHWLHAPDTPAALREQLARSQQMRDFASTHLQLPDNASYRRYVGLGRSHPVWNVVAAPPDALTLHRWCYPVLGCVGYRGYFKEAHAREMGAQLQAQGLEVHVYGVPAYSTLGWSNWVGGDPLLSSFIQWSAPELAGLIFHELAHQHIYIADDSAFNESFASAVQRIGTQQWIAHSAQPQHQAVAAAAQARRHAWQALTRETRSALAQLYAEHAHTPLTHGALQARKHAVLAQFRAQYDQLRTRWLAQWRATQPPGSPAQQRNPWAPTDAWVAGANNASFGALALYDDWTPAFEAMHQRAAGDWGRFYDAVRALAALPRAQRHAALCALLPADLPHHDCVRNSH